MKFKQDTYFDLNKRLNERHLDFVPFFIILALFFMYGLLYTGLNIQKGDFMRRYEIIFIVDPDVTVERRGQIFDKVKEIIKNEDGFLAKFDEWGIKTLAYEVRKKPRGYYVCMDLCGAGSLVAELERNFRLDDKVLKFMTILTKRNISIEQIKEELNADNADVESKEDDKTEETKQKVSEQNELDKDSDTATEEVKVEQNNENDAETQDSTAVSDEGEQN